jgi:hypothetical protein
MDETAAGTMMSAAILQALMRELVNAGVITPAQFNSVLDDAEKILADYVAGSRDEAANLETARSLMAQRKEHWR